MLLHKASQHRRNAIRPDDSKRSSDVHSSGVIAHITITWMHLEDLLHMSWRQQLTVARSEYHLTNVNQNPSTYHLIPVVPLPVIKPRLMRIPDYTPSYHMADMSHGY